MFVRIGVIIRNHFPKSVFNCISNIVGYLPKNILWGHEFTDTYTFLKNSELWSKNKIEEYQLTQIREVIRHAYENVPYYMKLFDDNGISPKDIKSFEDIKKIPYLTKELVKENYDKLVSKNIRRGEYLVDYTGGSTSEPMKFLVDYKSIPRELAFFKYAWGNFGYTLGTKCIELKGAKVARSNRNIFWKYDSLLNLLKMDSDYLNDEKYIQYYLKKIKKFNSNYLFGFPSSIYLLAKQIEENKIEDFPKIKLIMLASENTYDWQLDYMKRIFGSNNIFYHYGHSEKATLAVKCLNENILHFLPQYGYTEIINKYGETAKPGELGEIVATSYNKCFPLIRYKTKDYAIVSNKKCGCLWENYLTVSHVEGRLQEFIVTKDKRLVSICTMGAAHFKDLSEVLRTQYYQDTKGKLIFRIVPFPNKPIADKTLFNIKYALEEKLEHYVEVDVQIVNSIDTTSSGKQLMIKQKLDIRKYI